MLPQCEIAWVRVMNIVYAMYDWTHCAGAFIPNSSCLFKPFFNTADFSRTSNDQTLLFKGGSVSFNSGSNGYRSYSRHISFANQFLPRCMQCRRGIVRRILSVCLSVSPAWSLTKRKKDRSRFLYHTKEHLSQFSEEEEWLVGGDPFYLKFWVNRPPLERNRRFSTNNRS